MKQTILLLCAYILTSYGNGNNFDPSKYYPNLEPGDFWVEIFDQRGLQNVKLFQNRLYTNTNNLVNGDDYLYCLNLESGLVEWKINVDSYASQPVNFVDDGLFYVSVIGGIYKISFDGKLLWNLKSPSPYSGHLINPLNQNLIVVSRMNGFYEFHNSNGELIGHYAKNEYISNPAFDEDKLIYSSKNINTINPEVNLISINYNSLDTVFSTTIREFTIEGLFVINNTILFNNNRNKLFCCNASNGDIIWQKSLVNLKIGELPKYDNYGEYDEKIYCSINGALMFLDPKSGEKLDYKIDKNIYGEYNLYKGNKKFVIKIENNIGGKIEKIKIITY